MVETLGTHDGTARVGDVEVDVWLVATQRRHIDGTLQSPEWHGHAVATEPSNGIAQIWRDAVDSPGTAVEVVIGARSSEAMMARFEELPGSAIRVALVGRGEPPFELA